MFISIIIRWWKIWCLSSKVESINWELEVHLSNVIRVVSGWSKLDDFGRERAILMMMKSWGRERRVRKIQLLRGIVRLRGGGIPGKI